MKGQSTNALTKRYAESRGWLCETVQRFYGGRRHDLFGIADSLIGRGQSYQPLLAQNCSYGTLKKHRDAFDEPATRKMLDRLMECGFAITLVEWRQKKQRRGGKRMAREWWCRTQEANLVGGWDELTPWIGPHDLFPKRNGQK